MANVTLRKKLVTNKRAGLLIRVLCEIVHQSPPKNAVPSAMPAKNDNVTSSISAMLMVVIFFVFFTNFSVLARNPAPCTKATDYQSNNQQHEGPRIAAGKMVVDPHSDRDS